MGDVTNAVNGINGMFGGLFDELNKAGQGVPEACYVPAEVSTANLSKVDICSSLGTVEKLEEELCPKELPDIPGFKKKNNTITLNANNAIKEYCNTIKNGISSVIGNLDIYGSDLGLGGAGEQVAYPNGKSADTIDESVKVKKILSAPESAANKALLSGDQTTLRALVKQTKLLGTDKDISQIKPEDFKAPQDFKAYNQQTQAVASATNSDVMMANPISVSSGINKKIEGKTGEAARIAAANESMRLNNAIDAGTAKRIGLIMEATARPDDIAIPTQDTINLLRPDLKIAMTAKIQQQIARQALVMAEVQQIDDARKNIVSLTAQKSVILNEKFDRDAAENYIDGLLE
jgi:hypothetical protein